MFRVSQSPYEKIKCTSTHHFHKFFPKIQRSVKLMKLGHLLALILLFQIKYSIQFLLELFQKFVLDLTACFTFTSIIRLLNKQCNRRTLIQKTTVHT